MCQTVVCEKRPGEKWKKEFFCVVMVYLEATVSVFFFIISMQVCGFVVVVVVFHNFSVSVICIHACKLGL